ncbi:Tim44/TimA family putative adaptor protein [Micavibrio aeruginosavorus]|uniref:Tim44/TimA family putative adaptor protein n=1 Tax=Micavibrio aeruginosavorus TaxID=349221 RepID=UPI003F4AC374
MTADILLYALIAAGLVFWLRNVLGTRHGDERQRPNPFARPDNDAAARNGARPDPARSVVTPLHPARDDAPVQNGGLMPGILPGLDEPLPGVVLPMGKNMSAAKGAEAGLQDIANADHSFNATHFLEGAQDAFVMIVEAFAANDRGLLKNLLDPSLYAAFDGAMTAREERGEIALTEIHAIRRLEIVDARIQDKRALLTVRFVADETATIQNKDGEYISGNPDRVKETIDIWTFGKPLKSREPTWYLVATREEDADKKGMPETVI